MSSRPQWSSCGGHHGRDSRIALILEIARKAGHPPLGTTDRDVEKLHGTEKIQGRDLCKPALAREVEDLAELVARVRALMVDDDRRLGRWYGSRR